MGFVLIVPFVMLVTGAVSLVGYLSYRSGQEAVSNLANQLMDQTSNRVIDRLDTSLGFQQKSLIFNPQIFQQGNLNINDRQQMQAYLWQQMNFSPINNILLGTEEGRFLSYGRIISPDLLARVNKITSKKIEIGAPYFGEVNPAQPSQRNYYLADDRGRAKELVLTRTINTQTTEWYQVAKNAQKQTWSPIYVDRVVADLGIAAVVPIYDAKKQFQGVLASHFSLLEISNFLGKLKFSPRGQTFIMERSGDLVATSTLETPYFLQDQGKSRQFPATQSADHQTRAIAPISSKNTMVSKKFKLVKIFR
ncbi:MAG: hypothetical protein HC916_07990 [Coleofasciculaceae cyanobacterium SM2_1_6]|nr:hypothetical protein [Coleofasciculaceae cyanobacterium SM2_1_6]